MRSLHVIAFSLLLSITQVYAEPLAPASSDKSALSLILYCPKFQIEKGNSMDIVIEVNNKSSAPVSLSNIFGLERVRNMNGSATKSENVVTKSSYVRGVHLIVYCRVSAKYPERMASSLLPEAEMICIAPRPHVS